MSEKSTRNDLDYAVESGAAPIALFVDRNCSIGLAIPIRSGTIQANRCRKRRFRLTRALMRSRVIANSLVLGTALCSTVGDLWSELCTRLNAI